MAPYSTSPTRGPESDPPLAGRVETPVAPPNDLRCWWLLLCPSPLIHPVVDRFIPKLRILRLQHPVAFVGEVEHLGGYAHGLQRGEKLEAFAYIEAVVELSVDDKRRRFEILGRIPRRPLLVHLRIGVRSTLELPVIEPEFFGGAPGGGGVEHAVVRHNALKTPGMAEHPVGHVSAVARAQRALSVFINKRVSLLRVVEALHQVFKRSAAPVAIDGINELLPVSGRAVEVNHDDHVPIGGEEFG